ncbi:hypothetical protein [Saccharothrix texasensis]|uniref:hypothetical protein n=1 Tax=Saccharothrix texasensis TaxID=103734 RepID=UPI000F4BE7DE|nr:hypothetical protein [Saccharothrix texasensis]
MAASTAALPAGPAIVAGAELVVRQCCSCRRRSPRSCPTVRGDRSHALGNLFGSSVVTIVLMCVPAFFTRRQLSRWEGAASLAYTTWLVTTRL